MLVRRLWLREHTAKPQLSFHCTQRGSRKPLPYASGQVRGIASRGIDETPDADDFCDPLFRHSSSASAIMYGREIAESSDAEDPESHVDTNDTSRILSGIRVDKKSTSAPDCQRPGNSPDLARTSDRQVQETSLQEGDDEITLSTNVERTEYDEDAESAEYDIHKSDGETVLPPADKSIMFELTMLLQDKGWTELTENFLLKKHSQKELSVRVVLGVLLRLQNESLACSLFEWTCRYMGHDVSIYKAHLKTLGEAKQFDKMWDLLATMKAHGMNVDFTAFCIMIRACRVAGVPTMAVQVFQRAPQYGIRLNISLYRALLSTLFLMNQAREAMLLYSRIIQQGLNADRPTFNTLVHGFGLTLSLEDAKKSFHELQKAGIKPNLSSYEALISAFCNAFAIDKAVPIFLGLRKRGLCPTATTLNIIVEAFCKYGKVDAAMNLVDDVKSWCLADSFTYISIFNGLLVKKDVSQAIWVFGLMEKWVHMHRWMYVHLMNGLRQVSQTEEIQGLLEELFARHGYANAEVCIALLHNLTSLGQVEKAEGLFEGMLCAGSKPILQAYTTMINCYCRLEKLDRALQVFLDLKAVGLKPNLFCYTPLIGALVNAGQIADAKNYYLEMIKQGYESKILCNHLLKEVSKRDMVAEIPEILTGIIREKLSIRGSTFFELAKCLCKTGKTKETNILCSSLYELNCLELRKEAAKQVFGVMKVMPFN